MTGLAEGKSTVCQGIRVVEQPLGLDRGHLSPVTIVERVASWNFAHASGSMCRASADDAEIHHFTICSVANTVEAYWCS